MPRTTSDVPTYCHHRRSGRGYATFGGRQHTFPGPYNSPQSRAAYDRLIAEFLNAGRTLPAEPDAAAGPTVSMIAAAFWRHAQAHYVRADGTPTGEAGNYKPALAALRRLYGPTAATDFGPKSLKALRRAMTQPQADGRPGWSRTYANRQADRIKYVFRWAASEELIPAAVAEALATVEAIRKGRDGVREAEAVEPVKEATVEKTLPHLPPPVAALVKLQLLTGARGRELFTLRTRDIDRTGEVWECHPAGHKTAHHGHGRTIYFGPKAQAILAPFLSLDPDRYLFRPADALAWRDERQRLKRMTPLTPSQRRRADEAARNPRRRPKPRYDRTTYARAVARACEVAFGMPTAYSRRPGDTPERREERAAKRAAWHAEHGWHPHQLRHAAGTRYRRQGDFEAAKIILGHQSDSMTQQYAERDQQKARAIVAQIG